MYPGGGGLKDGQKNILDLSMSDVVTNMGEMGDGGDRTKRENPCREDSKHAFFFLIKCRTGHQLRQGLLHSGKTANLNCK